MFLLVAVTPSSAVTSRAPQTVSYTALSDAARASGQLARYDGAPTREAAIDLAGYHLDLTVPRTARAYDVIPISYTLTQPLGRRRAAVEAVAFEDAAKAGDTPLYDMAIPGDLDVKIEYLGSVSADFDNEHYIPLTADPKTPVSPFPPYKRDSMVRSSNVRAANAVWFKFRITNTGDTILDPEGFGASFMQPHISKLKGDGSVEWTAGTVNMFERQLSYLYPGESTEQWVNFFCPQNGGDARGLKEGDYRIDLSMLYRYYRDYNWGVNIWAGKEFAKLTMPIRVTAKGGKSPVQTSFEVTDKDDKMPGYFDRFEEFMTSFRVHRWVREDTVSRDKIYLQVAPWTEKVVVKLILTDPRQIAVAKIPIRITNETLDVKYNPGNVMVVNQGGKQMPAFVAQSMPAMRTGFQLGPYPEKHLLQQIQEMKDLGVNVLANTAGSWWAPEIGGRKGVELHSACYKYWYDVLARRLDMKLMGWCVYPPTSPAWYANAAPLLGVNEVKYSTADSTYGGHAGVDRSDPIVPEVIAAWAKYNYERWGDMWFKTSDGRVPIDIEDTWGWMRDDINIRYMTGPLSVQRFRDWAKAKYGDISQVNAAWGSQFADFSQIEPEKDQGVEGDGIDQKPVYNKPENPFHDWSPAVSDWDVFRTELRMDTYQKANEIIRRTIPGGELALRTEGANLVVPGDGTSDNMHWRHVYYSQRRDAMVFDVVKQRDVIHFYSDYTTLPYTEQEWRQAMREMVAAGVIPVFVPQFDHMRDILLNPYYGRQYQMHYGLDQPSKGMMVHCLMAAYPWWKATYEEGGAPGMIWSDYLCDGFATETTKRELKLLTAHFAAMEK